jgi:hypothetical protein
VNTLSKIFATVAAIAVLTVLITPAMDELPSTAPHASQMTVVLYIAAIPLILPQFFPALQWPTRSLRLSGGIDLISLTCTRLC